MAENETKQAGSIQINAQYVKDLSFEGPALPFRLILMSKSIRAAKKCIWLN